MSYTSENQSDPAQAIQQFIYDASIYETEPQPLKGDAAWWAEQIGRPVPATRAGLEELVGSGTLMREGDGQDATYLYVPVTVVSPELHGDNDKA